MVKFDTINDFDMENAQVGDDQATWQQTRDFAASGSDNRFDVPVTQAPMLKPQKSCSSRLIETSLIRKCITDSLRSLIEEWKDRIMLVQFAFLKPKSELGELEGFLEFVGLEFHYKQPDFEGNLSHKQLVKPLLCGFMQKGSLENHIFRKHIAIDPESCNKELKITIGANRCLAFHHFSEEQDMHKDLMLNNILINLKVSDMLRDRTTKTTSRCNFYAGDAYGYTTLNIPCVSQQRGMTNMEIQNTLGWTGAPRAKTIVETISQWCRNRSYLHKTCPPKVKNESQENAHHVALLICTLLATVTFRLALKFYLPRCRFEEFYESNSGLVSVSKIENLTSYSTDIFIMFNSVAFFLSSGMMMILFNGLPFRPWLLVLGFSMIGSYMCTLMDAIKPRSCSS